MDECQNLRIAYILTTYNRVDEVKGQQEIIRHIWEPLFAKVDIYHEFNGPEELYTDRYLENKLFKHQSMPHYLGAAYLIDQGISHVVSSGKDYDYIVVSSGDVWFYNPQKIREIFQDLEKGKYQLATSLYSGPLFVTEFFIITPALARKVFPLRFGHWYRKFFLAAKVGESLKLGLVETLFTIRVVKAIKSVKFIYFIPGRRFVSGWRIWKRHHSKDFYSSEHNKHRRKKQVIQALSPHISKEMREVKRFLGLDKV